MLYPNIFFKKRYYIDPLKIIKVASLPIKPKQGSAFFLEGEWDKDAQEVERVFDNNYKYKTAREIIVRKLSLLDTEEYQHVQNKIDVSGVYRGYRDPLAYMKSVQNLYSSINLNGYRLNNNRVNKWSGEIEIAIGRGGEIIKMNSGNHRFACAYMLELESVPVHVCAMHLDYKDHIMADGILKLDDNIEKIINE